MLEFTSLDYPDNTEKKLNMIILKLNQASKNGIKMAVSEYP